ncbi:MAG: cysteine desulfurase family protein [Planctomycetota bacterium]
MDLIYLDNNATTRPSPEVAAAVAEAHEAWWANPSSVYRFGQQVRQRLELARASVARLIGARPRELVFTSGGTEACALALDGVMDRWGAKPTDSEGPGPGGTLITSWTEHAAVRELAEAREKRGGVVVWLPTVAGGAVDVAALIDALGSLGGPALVSAMWANNETGVVQPIGAVAAAVAEARGAGKEVWLHTDATQAVGKLPVDVNSLPGGTQVSGAPGAGVDLLSFAGHKFHGPKGVGGLWVRRGVRLLPQQHGGPQETERRGGTENVPGVIGMGVAADQASAWVRDAAEAGAQGDLRDRLEARIQHGLAEAGLPTPAVNSGGSERLWNTTNLGFRGLEAEAILLGLSERGVCASAGAACSSGSLEPSPVLLAMGVEEAVAHGSIRWSLSRHTTAEEIDAAAAAVVAVVGRLAKVMPMGG